MLFIPPPARAWKNEPLSQVTSFSAVNLTGANRTAYITSDPVTFEKGALYTVAALFVADLDPAIAETLPAMISIPGDDSFLSGIAPLGNHETGALVTDYGHFTIAPARYAATNGLSVTAAGNFSKEWLVRCDEPGTWAVQARFDINKPSFTSTIPITMRRIVVCKVFDAP